MLCEWPFFDSIHYIIIGFRRGTNHKPKTVCFLSLHCVPTDASPMVQMHHVLRLRGIRLVVVSIRPLCTRVICKFTVNWIENNLVYGPCERARPSLDGRR